MNSQNNKIALTQPKFQELLFMLSNKQDSSRSRSLEPAIKKLGRFTKKGSSLHQFSKSKGCLNDNKIKEFGYNSLCNIKSDTNVFGGVTVGRVFFDKLNSNKNKRIFQLDEVDCKNIKCYTSRINGCNEQRKKIFGRDYYKKELNSLSLKLFGDVKSKYQKNNRNLFV